MTAVLAKLLRSETNQIMGSWSTRFERSPMRLHREVAASTYVGLVAPLCDALAVAVSDGVVDGRFRPGQHSTRDIEQGCGFVGARLASNGAAGFDVAAVILSLRDSVLEFASAQLAAPLNELFEWLLILALDAFASAGIRSLEERAAEQLELGTPVLLVTPEVLALVLVGEPPAAVLENILARALMAVVAASASTLIIDVSGLGVPDRPALVTMMTRWFASEALSHVHLALVGVSGEVRRLWIQAAARPADTVSVLSSFDQAVTAGLARSGTHLRRRPPTSS